MKLTFLIFFSFLAFHLSYSQSMDSSKTTNLYNTNNTNDTTVYSDVDRPASFPGGDSEWIKFVSKTLNPSVASENGIKYGKYNVIIRFVVKKDGTLENFVAETNFKHGLEEEVIRMLKLSPKWIPAKKNNIPVNSIRRQNMMFNIQKGH